jgi:hypothetical protein
VTAEVPFDLGECGLLKLAGPGSKGHLWDAIVARRGHDPRVSGAKTRPWWLTSGFKLLSRTR